MVPHNMSSDIIRHHNTQTQDKEIFNKLQNKDKKRKTRKEANLCKI